MLTDENVGQMLKKLVDVEDALGHCAEQNEEIRREVGGLSESFDSMRVDLTALSEAQQKDDETRSTAATVLKVIKTVGIVASVVLLPLFGWLGKEAYAQYSDRIEHVDGRLDEVETGAADNAHGIETHNGTIGHEPLRARVDSNRENIATLGTTLDTIVVRQGEIQESQTRIERAVRRPRAWGQ